MELIHRFLIFLHYHKQKSQPTQVQSLCLATFRVLCPSEFFSINYFSLEGKINFLSVTNLWSGLKIGYERYTLSLLYKFKEFDQNTC